MKKRWKDKSGMTLVELIVTFALIGIFMTAASFVVSSGLRLFTKMKENANAVTVSDFLLDKMVGEIAAAKNTDDEGGGHYYFWLSQDATTAEGSQWVVFENRVGSPIAMYAAEEGDEKGPGRLFLKYYDTGAGTDTPGTSKADASKDINWHFDSRAYMGYSVQSLRFFQPAPKDHPNVIRIVLELKNDRTGFVYKTERYAKNYSFDDPQNMCVRSDGSDGMPKLAEEFRNGSWTPPPDPDTPDPEEDVTYTVYYLSTEPPYDEIAKRKTGSGPVGKPVYIGLQDIPGYVYNAAMSGLDEQGYTKATLSEGENEIYLYYDKKAADEVHYMVVYVDSEKNTITPPADADTGGTALVGLRVRITPPNISGYTYNPDLSKQNEEGQVMSANEKENQIYLVYDKQKTYPDVPFPPAGPNWEIDLDQSEKDMYNAAWKTAEKFSEFFLNDWHVLKTSDGDIGYRTFTAFAGGWEEKTFAIAGYCDLGKKGSNSIHKYEKKIAEAAGVDKQNIILLTGITFKEKDGLDILWEALFGQIIDLPEEDKNLLSDYVISALNFESVGDSEKVQYVLRGISLTSWKGKKIEIVYKE